MAKIKTTENSSKKEIIIEHAAKLFKEKGFKAASMRELAAVVGVEAASLYNHIQSKGELLKAICFNVANRYTSNIELLETEKSSVIEKVEKLLRFHIREMIENYEEVYVTDNDWRNMEDPELSEYREMRRSYRKRFAQIVQQGIDAGELKCLDANSAVMVFVNAIAAIDQWHRIVHKVSREDIEENIITILVNGIKK